MNYCRFCGSELEKMFDLGILPLGNPVGNEDKSNKIWTSKLDLEICYNCYLGQTVSLMPEENLVPENHYVTVSKQVIDHMNQFYSYLKPLIPSEKNPLLLEVGSGDGSLANALSKRGYTNFLGVEPLHHLTIECKFELIEDFFNAKVVKELKEKGKVPDIVICYYVISLIPNLNDFFRVGHSVSIIAFIVKLAVTLLLVLKISRIVIVPVTCLLVEPVAFKTYARLLVSA